MLRAKNRAASDSQDLAPQAETAADANAELVAQMMPIVQRMSGRSGIMMRKVDQQIEQTTSFDNRLQALVQWGFWRHPASTAGV